MAQRNSSKRARFAMSEVSSKTANADAWRRPADSVCDVGRWVYTVFAHAICGKVLSEFAVKIHWSA